MKSYPDFLDKIQYFSRHSTV